MGEPIRGKSGGGDIFLFWIIAIGTALVLFFTCGYIFQIDYGQSEPTSDLITTNISIPLYLVDIPFYPGAAVEVKDKSDRGYLYTPWFKPMIYGGHDYEIQYYCDKDGHRRIYKYRDLTVVVTDIAKCVVVNGVCQ